MILRPFRPGDEQTVNATFNEVFRQTRSLDEWYWKFGAPEEPKYIMLAWDENGQLLAQWAAVPVRLWAFSQELTAAQVVDVFSRKIARTSLRAAGAYLGVMREFHRQWCGPEGFSLLYGFPSRRPLELDQKSGEYTQIPDLAVPQFWRPIRRPGLSRIPLGLRLGPDPAAADALWAACKDRLILAVVRNGAYFLRRYWGRPRAKYHHAVVWRNGKPRAYGVFAIQGRAVLWAELLWDGESQVALEILVEEGERLGKLRGCVELRGWLRGDPLLASQLRALNWKEEEHPEVRWLGRSFDPRVPPERVPDSLYFTLGDSDLV